MGFKPLEERTYRKYLREVSWSLEKGGIDYKLIDENGVFLCAIKIHHSKRGKQEVSAYSIQQTERWFKVRGWSWPPKKK
jgi:hypothetical protein